MLFLLHEIGLCLAGLLMASENTDMQSYFCGSCNAISFDYYGIEFVKLESNQPIETPSLLISLKLIERLVFINITYINSTFGVLKLPVYLFKRHFSRSKVATDW